METAHPHIKEVISKFWTKKALELNPFETLSLIDLVNQYNKSLSQYGISDDSIENGYLALCNAYARKIHSQIMPFIVSTLKAETETSAIETD